MSDADRIATLEAKVEELEKSIEEMRASIPQQIKEAFDSAGREVQRQMRNLDL